MRARPQVGAAVVDFCLVMVVLVPLVLGIMQVALVLHVRNTMTAAASEGARRAATYDAGPAQGVARTRQLIDTSLAGHYARDVVARQTRVDGLPGVVVTARAEVPALGVLGPALDVEVEGLAVEEELP